MNLSMLEKEIGAIRFGIDREMKIGCAATLFLTMMLGITASVFGSDGNTGSINTNNVTTAGGVIYVNAAVTGGANNGSS